MNLLIHVDEIDKWSMAIGNALNSKKAKKNIEVEIVATGSAAIILKEKVAENYKLKDKLNQLNDLGIKIAVCNNSLNKLDMKANELLECVVVVKTGMIEILEKQEAGYAYVKP